MLRQHSEASSPETGIRRASGQTSRKEASAALLAGSPALTRADRICAGLGRTSRRSCRGQFRGQNPTREGLSWLAVASLSQRFGCSGPMRRLPERLVVHGREKVYGRFRNGAPGHKRFSIVHPVTMQPGKCPQMPLRCTSDADHGGDLGLRAPSGTGERFRFREFGSNLAFMPRRQRCCPSVTLEPLRSRTGIEARRGGWPADHP